ncbi:MAG: hypothetical protein R3290_10010 [Acidimicrobiia bacterium]|nr:hypothetical protein [Acidimicrobiia bacterium]
MDARELIRWTVVGLAGVTALLYALIGTNVVSLGRITPEEQRAFGIAATVVFAVGAVVGVLWDERWIWIVGAGGLALIIVMYFSLASRRDPRFEIWGILIRVAQVPLLVGLASLAFTAE